MPADTALTYQQAIEAVLQHASQLRPSGSERVPLLQSAGRVLAYPVRADRNLPPFPRSTRDGFAVRSEDCATPGANLTVVGEIRAGANPESMPAAIVSGQCVEIMTGAPVPAGADAVLMYEYAQRSGDQIRAERAVANGENVVPAGAEAKAGDDVLPVGLRMDYASIALAASVGWSSPSVYRKPRVIILPTGDEIVDVASTPGRHQIRNSNSYSLAAQITAAGGEPMQLPVAPDDPGRLRELIGEGLQGDLLLLSGGVSAGKYDYVEQVLQEFDAKFHFTSVLIQPGKPLVFGDARGTLADADRRVPFFGLPGNPISTMVTFELFVRPMLDSLCGAKPHAPQFLHAELASKIKTKTGLTRFLPGKLSGNGAETTVELVRWQGSGDVVSTANASCYVVVPPDRNEIAAGEMIPILLRNMGS